MVLGDIKSKPQNLRKTPNKFQKTLDFLPSFGIMCITTRKPMMINEKKIEMLDYKKKTNLLENYYKTFAKGAQNEKDNWFYL